MSDSSGNNVGLAVEERPVGRDEVIEATLKAAATLFAQRNPSQVSVREIASRAGVSHALVHRYLGSKEDIFHAALMRERQEAADYWLEHHGMSETAGTLREDLPPGRFMRTVLRARLEGMEIPEEELRLPHADKMLEHIKGHPFGEVSSEPFDPRLLFSACTAMLAGMAVAEDFFLAQSGIDGQDREQLRSELNRLVGRVLSLAENS